MDGIKRDSSQQPFNGQLEIKYFRFERLFSKLTLRNIFFAAKLRHISRKRRAP